MNKKEYIVKNNTWKRFIARNIDIFIFWFFFWLLLWFFAYPSTRFYYNRYTIYTYIILLWMFYEFFLLSIFWNTPWKMMLWLKIINTNNSKKCLTIKQCFIRSIIVNWIWWIPLIWNLFWIYQYIKLKNNWITTYDSKLNTQIYEFNKKVNLKQDKENIKNDLFI